MAIGRVLGKCGKALELALRLCGGFGRKLRGLDAIAEFVYFLGSRVALADLRLDLAHPPAEQFLASLRIPFIRSRLLGESALCLCNRHLAIEMFRHALETPCDVRLLEQCNLLLRCQRQCRGDEIREQPRARKTRDEGLPLLGQIVAQVDDALCLGDHLLPGGIAGRRRLVDLGERFDSHAHAGVVPHRVDESRAGHTNDDRLLAVAARVDHARHAHDARDRMEIVETGILGLRLALARDHQESTLARGGESCERLGATDRQRTRYAREHHGVAYRKQRQHLRNIDAFATCSNHDATRCFRQVTPIHSNKRTRTVSAAALRSSRLVRASRNEERKDGGMRRNDSSPDGDLAEKRVIARYA